MKNLLNKLMLIAVAPLLFITCTDDDTMLATLNPDATVDVSLSTSNVVLDSDNADMEALIISWTQPDFGYKATVKYKILIDTIPISVDTVLQKSLTTTKLNRYLLDLGFEQGIPKDVQIKVIAGLGLYNSIESEVQTLTATAYDDSFVPVISTWGVVGSAANDWGATPDLPFYTTSKENVFVANVTLIDGEIKFRENNSWDLNYGDTGADGTLDEGGDNISIVAGAYKITINLNDLTYTIETI